VNRWQALMSPLDTAKALRRAGVLGMNRRNHDFTMQYNSRHFYPRADNKLETKRLCEAAGIPTAQVLGVARFQAQIRLLLDKLDERSDFVLKPAHGAMGNGILVIRERRDRDYLLAGGAVVGRERLAHHMSSILSGMFSLGGKPDVAFAEERLTVHPELARVVTDGVPDIRFVIFQGVPVMAMTRLPTSRSGGRANLHHGAVGAGIDLRTGRTTHAVLDGEVVTHHPDSQEPLLDLPLPDFERALTIAVEATTATQLGYVGADVVVDANHGALILELNARPGLAIQVANQTGLAPRLEEIVARGDTMSWPLAARIALGRELEGRK
jgi:alpha-L-glutamate ligase-like protein